MWVIVSFKGEGLGGGEKWDFLYYPVICHLPALCNACPVEFPTLGGTACGGFHRAGIFHQGHLSCSWEFTSSKH